MCHFVQIISTGLETICMRCRNVINLSSAELIKRMVKVNMIHFFVAKSGIYSYRL